MKATWYIISGMRVKFVYECHGVKVKVTGAKKGKKKSLFPQCETSIGYNSGSVKHRAMKFVRSVGFLDMADQMACLVTGSDHTYN